MPHIEKVHQELGDAFWKEHYPKLQRYCHFLAQNHWDGDDIAHETFLKALRYTNPTAALLNKIAYHHWIDMVRKRKNESHDLDKINLVTVHSFENISESVNLLLRQFTPKQAVIFLLKEAFQFQVKEIADLLATTEMAVKASLHRAKKRLDKEDDYSLESFWDEEEREYLSDLFYEALKMQDPTVLIESIPRINSIRDTPKPSLQYTPSSTLCMAA